jgi:peroxiredoxin (alkyl hydroperoxide reductase subunit C)
MEPLVTLERAFVGKKAPAFTLPSTRDMDALDKPVNLADYKGRWVVLLFYPLDFTFVCPTELVAFSDRYNEFTALGADVVGISTDSVYSHRAWIQQPRKEGGLGELRYPLASDPTHAVSRAYGVLLEDEGFTLRGTFVIDPEGTLRYALVHDNGIGRSSSETLRVLQALQSGGLCAVDWQPGDKHLQG